MPHEVRATPTAAVQIDALRGPNRRAYDAFLIDLANNGCEALSYRLSGREPLPRLCVRHLRGALRVVAGFDDGGVAWVLLVGPHDRDPDRNIYDLLYRMLGAAVEPDEQRRKPPCCDAAGAPPVVEVEVVNALAQRTRATLGRRQRR